MAVSSVFAARYLGPQGVGRIALIAFVIFTMSTLLTLGLPWALYRFSAQLVGAGRGGEAHALFRWTWRLELFAAVVVFAILALAGLLGASPRAAWALAGVVAAGAVMNDVVSAFLRGLQRWREARIMGIASGSLALVCKVIALVLGGGIVSLFAIDALTTVGNVLGTLLFGRRAARALPLPAPVEIRPVLRFAGIASINLFISVVVFQRIEVFFLAHYSNDVQIALYTIPFSIVTALLLIPQAIGFALAPAIATLWGAGEIERIRSGFSRSLRIVLLLVILITAFAAALMPSAIRLVYGPAFAKAGPVAVILLLTLPFVPLGVLSSSLLLGIGRQWGLTIIGAIAATVDIALDRALIPPYGAVGAAIANAAAQLTATIPVAVYAIRLLGGVSLRLGSLLRATTAALVAALAVVLVAHTLPVTTGFALGLLVYPTTVVLASVILRPLSAEDGSWLDETAGGWAYGLVGLICRCLTVRPSLRSP